MILYTIAVVISSLIAIAAIGVIGYFVYRYGYDKGHVAGYNKGTDEGYAEAQDKYKQPELTPEQVEAKKHRERFESNIGRLFAYKVPSRRS